MIHWENASQFELNRLEAIKILLAEKKDVLDFLIHPDRPELTAPIEDILQDISCFNDEEDRVLAKLSLCIWGEPCCDLEIGDVFNKLNGESFKRYMKALLFTVQNPCTEKSRVATLDDFINKICMGRGVDNA